MMTVLLLIADDNDSYHCVDGVRVIVVLGMTIKVMVVVTLLMLVMITVVMVVMADNDENSDVDGCSGGSESWLFLIVKEV